MDGISLQAGNLRGVVALIRTDPGPFGNRGSRSSKTQLRLNIPETKNARECATFTAWLALKWNIYRPSSGMAGVPQRNSLNACSVLPYKVPS